MRRLIVLLVLLATACAGDPPRGDDALLPSVNAMVARLERLTGWKAKRPIRPQRLTREQLRRFLNEQIRREIRPEELRREELALKMFGLVPESFDLRGTMVDLLTEQAAAFYDYHRKRLFVLEGADDPREQQITLVHELAHFLADERFSLNRFMKKDRPTDDAAQARTAVMEGQATWLMWAWAVTQNQPGDEAPELPKWLVDAARSSASADQARFPVMAGAPLYLRESMMFPYTQGLTFQEAIYRQQGRAGLAAVFLRPPVSTHQIFHPEAYGEGRVPVKLTLPGAGKPWARILDGDFGEFDHRALLATFYDANTAARVGPGWRGGAFSLYEAPRGGVMLIYASEWESPEAAATFLTLYRGVLEKKLPKMKMTQETGDRFVGVDGNEGVELWRDGARVFSRERRPTAWRRANAERGKVD
jgi:hypothetical protein